MPSPDARRPAAWNSYVSVTDIEATAGPGDRGRRARDRPPAGRGRARAGWPCSPTTRRRCSPPGSPPRSPAAGLVNAPGCFCWSELACRDTRRRGPRSTGACSAGRRETSQMGPMTYTEWRLGGRAVGGMVAHGRELAGGRRAALGRVLRRDRLRRGRGPGRRPGRPGGGPARGRPAGAPGGDRRPAGRRGLHDHQAGQPGRPRAVNPQAWPRTPNPQASNPAERLPRGNPAPRARSGDRVLVSPRPA